MAQDDPIEFDEPEVFDWDTSEEDVEWERRLERSDRMDEESYGNSTLDLGDADWDGLTEGYDYDEKREEPEEEDIEEYESVESDEGSTEEPWFRSSAWKYVTFGLVLIVLILVLFKLLTDQRANNIAVRNLEDAVEEAEEDLAGADLRRLLDRAMEESDLRMMIRIRYLMLIQKMDENGLITYRKDRSNWSYHSDLIGPTQQRFGRLTRIFDYIWYGNVQPSATDESQVAQEIESFMIELGSSNEQVR